MSAEGIGDAVGSVKDSARDRYPIPQVSRNSPQARTRCLRASEVYPAGTARSFPIVLRSPLKSRNCRSPNAPPNGSQTHACALTGEVTVKPHLTDTETGDDAGVSRESGTRGRFGPSSSDKQEGSRTRSRPDRKAFSANSSLSAPGTAASKPGERQTGHRS